MCVCAREPAKVLAKIFDGTSLDLPHKLLDSTLGNHTLPQQAEKMFTGLPGGAFGAVVEFVAYCADGGQAEETEGEEGGDEEEDFEAVEGLGEFLGEGEGAGRVV